MPLSSDTLMRLLAWEERQSEITKITQDAILGVLGTPGAYTMPEILVLLRTPGYNNDPHSALQNMQYKPAVLAVFDSAPDRLTAFLDGMVSAGTIQTISVGTGDDKTTYYYLPTK